MGKREYPSKPSLASNNPPCRLESLVVLVGLEEGSDAGGVEDAEAEDEEEE